MIKRAFKTSVPVMMGYMVLGMAFGILLESKGYGVFYALLMSVFIYAGSMQFVGIDLLCSGASLITAGFIIPSIIGIIIGLLMMYKGGKAHV